MRPCPSARAGRSGRHTLIALAAAALLFATACGRATPGGGAIPAPPGPAVPPPTPAAARGAVPHFSHVFLIVMENLGFAQAVRLPFIAALMHRYGYASDYYAVAHPSLPNYLALASGHTWVGSDCLFCYVSADNLGAQAAAAGVSWGAYMEGLPAPCWLGPLAGYAGYAGKHDPFRYFRDVRGSPALCARIRPLTELLPLLPVAVAAAQVPRLVWITPNLCHDMHNCAPPTGDAWLRSFVPQILASSAWRRGGVLFVTWDEGQGGAGGGGRVLTLVLYPGMAAGTRVAVRYSHYSLLATIEDGLGLPLLGHAATATPLAAFWPAG